MDKTKLVGKELGMREAIGIALVGLAIASGCFAQTNTPTPANTPTAVNTVTHTPASLIASDPFLAINLQGRPMVGGTVGVTDAVGVPQTVWANAAGSMVYPGIVPGSGLVQFFAPPGTYIVSVSVSGFSRTYYTEISSAAGALTDADFPGPSGGMIKTNTGSYSTLRYNLSANTDPTANDDNTTGFAVGSIWINVASNNIFFATDVGTGAAVWQTTGVSAITSIESATGPAVTFTECSAGTDFTINNTSATNIDFCLPSAGAAARGLVTTSPQTFAGIKNFSGTTTLFQRGIVVNTDGSSVGSSVFETDNFNNAFAVDSLNDDVTFFIDDGSPFSSKVVMQNLVAGKHTLYVFNSAASGSADGLISVNSGANSGAAIKGRIETNGTGTGILGVSATSGGLAGQFNRSVAAATVPAVQIYRNVNNDTQALLDLQDLTTTTTATYAVQYRLNTSTIKAGIRTDGRFAGTPSDTLAIYTFIGDEDSGFGDYLGDIPIIFDEGVGIATFSNSAGIAFAKNVAITGEIQVSGVSGTGKAVCVKSDSNFGVCADTVGAGGTCTCG